MSSSYGSPVPNPSEVVDLKLSSQNRILSLLLFFTWSDNFFCWFNILFLCYEWRTCSCFIDSVFRFMPPPPLFSYFVAYVTELKIKNFIDFESDTKKWQRNIDMMCRTEIWSYRGPSTPHLNCWEHVMPCCKGIIQKSCEGQTEKISISSLFHLISKNDEKRAFLFDCHHQIPQSEGFNAPSVTYPKTKINHPLISLCLSFGLKKCDNRDKRKSEKERQKELQKDWQMRGIRRNPLGKGGMQFSWMWNLIIAWWWLRNKGYQQLDWCSNQHSQSVVHAAMQPILIYLLFPPFDSFLMRRGNKRN